MDERTIVCGCGEFPEGERGPWCTECSRPYRTLPTALDTAVSVFRPQRWGWFLIGWLANAATWTAVFAAAGAWP